MKKYDLYLVRHGETPWTLSDQHTGLTDIPLTMYGEQQARGLRERLARFSFDHVLTSPLQRAKRTCELAGYLEGATIDPDLVEWDYGQYEGKTTAQIHAERPRWNIFHDGVPGGESIKDIGLRADRVLDRIRALHGTTVVFSSGHFLRVLTARYLGLSVAEGRLFMLKPAAICILSYERDNPAILSWNLRDHF